MGLNDRPVSNVPRSQGLNGVEGSGRGWASGGGGTKRKTDKSHLNFQVHNNSQKNEATKSMTHTKKHSNTSKSSLFIL